MNYFELIEFNFETYWDLIQITVHDYITSGNVTESTLNERKNDIKTISMDLPKQFDTQLYVATESFLTNHVKQLVTGPFLLKLYQKAWTQYSQGMNDLDVLYEYRYLDTDEEKMMIRRLGATAIHNHIVLANCYRFAGNRRRIGDLGLEIWKKNMIISFRKKILNQILEGIHQDRIGDSGQDSLTIIGEVIQSFIDVEKYKQYNKMEFYQDEFEKPFLSASGEYYQKESDRFLSEGNMIEYMKKVTQLREKEILRSRKILDQSTYIVLETTFDQILISNVLPRLLEECSPIIAEERWSDLSLLYGLVKSVEGGLPPVFKEFKEYMKQRGEILLQISAPGPEGPKSPEEFVNRIMAFHAKNYEFIGQAFHGHGKFILVLDDTCASVINHNPNPDRNCPSIDLLVKYCDGILKKSSKKICKSNIEDKLAKAMIIFKYIEDKDIFEQMYKRSLARRLLHQQSQSLEVEAAMITRLTKSCGFEYTRKLNQMIKDTSLSADLTDEFNTTIINGNIELGIRFSIHVLQAGTWPIGTTIPSLAVPQILTTSIQKFEEFYKGQFNGRKLTWFQHLSQSQLHLKYLDKPYLVTMPTFQMAILLLFVNDESLIAKDVQETLQLDSDQFSKNVSSLVENKLIKSNTPTILPETVLSLNLEFKNKKRNFKLSAGPLKRDIPKKVKLVQGNVDEERKNYIKSLIIRIMKARKTLGYTALIQEVQSQPNGLFSPDITRIKKCIEILIEKDFIERNPNSRAELNYIP